jgi:hypothetical protein
MPTFGDLFATIYWFRWGMKPVIHCLLDRRGSVALFASYTKIDEAKMTGNFVQVQGNWFDICISFVHILAKRRV